MRQAIRPALIRPGHSRTGPPRRGGRYGLLLLVLVGTYLLAAFSSAKPVTETQVVLFAVVLLMALRTSPLPDPWPTMMAFGTLAGSTVAFWGAVSGTRIGTVAADFWKTFLLLMAAVMVVHRVLAKPTVTIQSIYGALSAYMIIGLMFASAYAGVEDLGAAEFFSGNQPANTQTFQYFSFTTLTTLGYGDFTAAENNGRAIAVVEALTGQVFMATLVARLVAAFHNPDRPTPPDDGPPEDVDGDAEDQDRH